MLYTDRAPAPPPRKTHGKDFFTHVSSIHISATKIISCASTKDFLQLKRQAQDLETLKGGCLFEINF